MILTNRVVSSDEALAWGLVEKVVPGESLLDEARRMAVQFSVGPTQGYAGAKRLQLAAFESDLATSLRLEAANESSLENHRFAGSGPRVRRKASPAVCRTLNGCRRIRSVGA
ncbi:enoyl-CoA hydratase-related protein [Achromobacter xylosoxidans]